jgi:hypothetical protein
MRQKTAINTGNIARPSEGLGNHCSIRLRRLPLLLSLSRYYTLRTQARLEMNEEVEISEGMIRAGVDALKEESYAIPQEELVDLIYSAMEYQRRREAASRTSS